MITKTEFIKVLELRHGKKLQERFLNSSVSICGLGGLGSNIAICLARAGVGKLHLIDFDRVDLSNINRQQYKISQIGLFKTDALKENLLEINPYCEIKTDCLKLTENNISVIKNSDIICEAFDNAECKAMLVNEVLEKFPEKYIVSASGMSGLHSANSIQTRKVMRKLYICGDEKSDIEKDGTLFSSRVMVCAGHQANVILQIINREILL